VLELKRTPATRVVATAAALDAAAWPIDALVLRVAPDEALVMPPVAVQLADPHAIVLPEGNFATAWVEAQEALDFLEQTCEWALPATRPAFAQGAVAGIPVKLWLEKERVLLVTPAPFGADLQERWLANAES
jgi:hypothetical protein